MICKIIGLGWYGKPLAEKLVQLGYSVSGTTTSPEKLQAFLQDNIQAEILKYPDIPSDLSADIIVLNIPPFADELSWFKKWPFKNNSWIIFISSTSNKEVLLEQEEWIRNHFQRWTILRFGGLIGGDRHPGKHLSGRKNLTGRLHPVNLIHQDDTVDATITVIEKRIINKTINVVSDEHPTREDYYTNWCKRHQLPLPEFDQTDSSTGKVVENEELKKFYLPKQKL